MAYRNMTAFAKAWAIVADAAAAVAALASSAKTTPVDADSLLLVDSAASNAPKTLTWANAVAALKTYFDSVTTTLTNKTLTTPVINGLPTGTGVASAATASTLVSRDSNGIIQAVNVLSAANAVSAGSTSGTTTLVFYSREVQQVNENAGSAHAFLFPTTFVNRGSHFTVVNNTTASTVTCKASDGTTLPGGALSAGTLGEWFALQDTPTNTAHWMKR